MSVLQTEITLTDKLRKFLFFFGFNAYTKELKVTVTAEILIVWSKFVLHS